MRVLNVQVWPIKAYKPFWWVLFIGGMLIWLSMVYGCTDPTAPTMRHVPTEEQVLANLKANGYTGTSGTCAPAVNGTTADVSACFMDLWKALAVTGSQIVTCRAAIVAGAQGGGAWGAFAAGAACSVGVFIGGDAISRYVEATQIGAWANQSTEEISNRMRQAIYERMIKNGKWVADNGGGL
jgi:hypothetical protein